jgi:hypothetical protein
MSGQGEHRHDWERIDRLDDVTYTDTAAAETGKTHKCVDPECGAYR